MNIKIWKSLNKNKQSILPNKQSFEYVNIQILRYVVLFYENFLPYTMNISNNNI